MLLIIDTEINRTSVLEGDDLKRLSASVRGQGDVARALGGLGRPDADGAHVWIGIAALRRAAAPTGDAAWGSGYDGMIAYATSKGWVDTASAEVRVHLVLP